MCGITAILNHNDCNIKPLIESMTSMLDHRGPDGWGTYVSEEVALGHSCLAIIDPDNCYQPIQTDRYTLVFNGEIYNYIEIRDELRKNNVMFHSNCDTEVVLKAFQYYKFEAFEKFNGQFVIIIWDNIEKRLIVARDRYGIRPLYCLNHDDSLFFSSELKSFDQITSYQRSFNLDKLYEHGLFWNTIGSSTIFNNIRSIPSGTYEVYNLNLEYSSYRYYELGQSSDSFSNINPTEEFTDLLSDSVKLRLRSDVPVGNYLSGGIDSSVITHLTQIHNNNRFKTFSIAFSDNQYDETAYQNEMVKQIQSDHKRLEISYQDIESNFFDALYHCERPLFRTAPIPLYLLSKHVNENSIKVVLTGEAADEILFGYDTFKELKLLEFWSKFPNSKIRPLLIKKLYPHLKHYADSKQYGLMRMYYEGFLKNYSNNLCGLNIRISNNKILSNYLNPDFNITFNEESLLSEINEQLPDNYSDWSLLQRNQFLEMKTLLPGYLLSSQGDRMSMAHSIEGRYPFLDHRLIDKVFNLPDSFKLKGFSQKHILTEAFKDKIPKSILKRPKQPYQAPDIKAFYSDNKLTEKAAYFLSEEVIDNYGIFNNIFIKRFLNKFRKGIPEKLGYRDNMIFTFILSTQMINYHIKNLSEPKINYNNKKVDISN